MSGLALKLEQLKALGAADFGHVDGNLLDHLIGTREILESWNARDALLDAGLFHASYSTAGFKDSLMDTASRDQIRHIIGADAEEIVYEYCACDRVIFYARLTPASAEDETPAFANRFTNQSYALDNPLLCDFCELSVANEIEIAQGNPKFVRKHGFTRYTIYTAMVPYLSKSARNRVEEMFG